MQAIVKSRKFGQVFGKLTDTIPKKGQHPVGWFYWANSNFNATPASEPKPKPPVYDPVPFLPADIHAQQAAAKLATITTEKCPYQCNPI